MVDLTQQNLTSRSGRHLILCFDGTGNKFQGNEGDSNIIKIFNLLDKQDGDQFHYYQPGIGTYTQTSNLSKKSRFGRIKSWYIKAKDQAIGTSFGEHVMAGYKFLMRYYQDGDSIYFFGFSRGAYTARFLAQMLDYVGLLTAGNEEMLRFAWKTFSRWQMRTEDSKLEKTKKHENFEFMRKFRETFSRPICRISFLGLFDCVNSVPQFEAAWMSRTRFPYTAKTSAKVIRHAVSIDERRAKFRQDLLSESRQPNAESHSYLDYVNGHMHRHHHHEHHQNKEGTEKEPESRPGLKKSHDSQQQFRSTRRRLHLPASNMSTSDLSVNSATMIAERNKEYEAREDFDHDGDVDEDDSQDILEVWFAGQHGDIGGGWPLSPGEERPLSDIALMWMIKEAHKAGMPFDEEKLKKSNAWFDEEEPEPSAVRDTPFLQVDGQPMPQSRKPERGAKSSNSFAEEYHRIATKSRVHDSLQYGGGLGWTAVTAWSIMEWLPFRRMDLQEDGSWKAISWPLPRGETRDIQHDIKVHHSVIKRMEADPNYRPGNLIIGGGGRGVRVAPKEYGMGKWQIVHGDGDLMCETHTKDLSEHAKEKAEGE